LAGAGGTIEHVSPAGLVLSGNGSAFAGTIDANGKPVYLNNANAGSGTGGTLATEGGTVTNGLYQTEGLLFFADIDSDPINTTPLPNTSAVRSSAAALHGGIGETQTLAFDGEIYLPAGDWSFGENVDDNVYVNINGTTILNDGQWNVPTSGTFNSAGGWYPVTLRVWNGGGGAGPVDDWYDAGIGIGIKTGGASTDVADYVRFEIGALGTKCRVTGPALNVNMAGGLTTGGGTPTTVDTREASITVGGPVDGPDPLAKTGSGTLTLNGSGSLTGAVTVQQGTLVLGPGASIGSAASVTVDSGATLAGTGTSAATTVNGTLSPGVGGIGAMSTTGTLAFGPSSVFIAEINSNGTPSADKVTVTGNVTIDLSTSVIFSDLGSTVLAGPV
jgi:autotransporter-associated beta strand protein